jgi:hypothetical protein
MSSSPMRQVGKVRLIVGIHAGHQFNVRTVGIGEAGVPGIPKFVITPRPLLFPGGDMVICYVHERDSRSRRKNPDSSP